MTKAFALLASVRNTLQNASEVLSVERAWSDTDHSTYQGQTSAALTLALVIALWLAHDAAPDTVLWRTPEEEHDDQCRRDKERGGNRDSGKKHRRGNGGSGGGSS